MQRCTCIQDFQTRDLLDPSFQNQGVQVKIVVVVVVFREGELINIHEFVINFQIFMNLLVGK